MRRAAEYGLCKSGKIDLLSEAITVFSEEGVGGDVSGQDVICCQISTVECEEQIPEPCIFVNERVKDRM